MEKMIPGLISVIIPTYNRRDMLLQAIEGIRSQDFPDVEILVVDDGSSDGTEEAMTAPDTAVRYLRNETNRGPGYSRRRGFLEAKGEYIVFSDDDDYYTNPRFFTEAVKVLSEDAGGRLAFVSANARILYVDENRFRESPLPGEGLFSGREYLSGFTVTYNKPLSTFTSVFRRSALEEGGLADSVQTDDRAIYLRALLTGDVFFLADVVGVYRIHSSNISSGITADFALSLLRENESVYAEILRRELLPAPRGWWYGQARNIVRFYIRSSRSDLKGLLRIFLYLRGRRISLREDLTLFRQSLSSWRSLRLAAKSKPEE